ncbi:hypothetical protein PoB_005751100 [Plakobranchus ocellatus]|uniref:Uncharacterized protein n=1 Tax=Plakobranchus ocellatus TaxID=259542 RepID=A0AAV4CHT4_9GAST|nr:hypothetical protein PoB_005751100 [Plakobranchus ocellatus]
MTNHSMRIALSKTDGVFFQRAIAYSKVPPSHQGKSSCYLAPQVTEAVRPVYKRLMTDALLSCCLRGMTQNANESLHAQIWQHCPKHLFAGRNGAASRRDFAWVRHSNFSTRAVQSRTVLACTVADLSTGDYVLNLLPPEGTYAILIPEAVCLARLMVKSENLCLTTGNGGNEIESVEFDA